MVIALTCFCSANYAQTIPQPGQQQHLYLELHKNDPMTPDHIKIKPLSDNPNDRFSYSHYANVNTETATLRLLEVSDAVAPDNGVAFHAQLTLMDNVPSLFIRFGVSIGNFKRTYSLNNEKLYYNWGHIDVFQGTEVDVYYDGNLYQVHYEGIQIECEEVGALSGLRETFVSSYGRTNTGGEVNLSFAPYQNSLNPCRLPSFRCADPSLGINLENCELVYLDCEETGGIGCYIPFSPSVSCTDIEKVECPVNTNGKLYAKSQDFTVHPNPAEDRLTITMTPLMDETIEISIIDAIGRLALHQIYDGLADHTNTFDFDITNLNSGIYYIKIGSAYKFETKKITIIK